MQSCFLGRTKVGRNKKYQLRQNSFKSESTNERRAKQEKSTTSEVSNGREETTVHQSGIKMALVGRDCKGNLKSWEYVAKRHRIEI